MSGLMPFFGFFVSSCFSPSFCRRLPSGVFFFGTFFLVFLFAFFAFLTGLIAHLLLFIAEALLFIAQALELVAQLLRFVWISGVEWFGHLLHSLQELTDVAFGFAERAGERNFGEIV